MAQLVKNLPAMRETWVQSLGWEDTLENETATHSSILAWKIAWSVTKSWTRLNDFHFHTGSNSGCIINLHVPTNQPQQHVANLHSFFLFLGHMARGLLVPQPTMEPAPLALEAQSPNHWTTREVPNLDSLSP